MAGKRRVKKTSVASVDESIVKTNNSDVDHIVTWLQDFDVMFKDKLLSLGGLLQKKMQAVEMSYDIVLNSIPLAIRNAKIGQWKSKENSVGSSAEVTQSSAVVRTKRTKRRSFSADSTQAGDNRRHTRSSSLNSRTVIKSTSKFKTPHTESGSIPNFITPKVKMDAPLSVVRHPRQGELAVSLSGSPLMVTSLIQNKRANVNIPLADGRVLSVLPEHGLRPYDVPSIDDQTREELRTLTANIVALINMTSN